MILFNGCSFTYGEIARHTKTKVRDEEIFIVKKTYSQFLGDELNTKTSNISMSGKDNLTMISDLITMLTWEKTLEEKIDIIVIQPTDFFRHNIPSYAFKKDHRINDLESQILFTLPGQRSTLNVAYKYAKLMVHSAFMRHKEYFENDKAFRIVQDGMQDVFVGDASQTWMKYQWCQKLMHLQLLCEIKKIKLVIMNYYAIGEEFKEDPLFKEINLDNFIIEDPFKFGMYSKLEQKAFTKAEDGFHWDIDAHKYQADIIEDFIKYNTKIKVRSDTELYTYTEIYDYTM